MKTSTEIVGLGIELSEYDRGELMRAAHDTPYTTRQLLDRLLAMHTANLHEDLKLVLSDLEEESEETE